MSDSALTEERTASEGEEDSFDIVGFDIVEDLNGVDVSTVDEVESHSDKVQQLEKELSEAKLEIERLSKTNPEPTTTKDYIRHTLVLILLFAFLSYLSPQCIPSPSPPPCPACPLNPECPVCPAAPQCEYPKVWACGKEENCGCPCAERELYVMRQFDSISKHYGFTMKDGYVDTLDRATWARWCGIEIGDEIVKVAGIDVQGWDQYFIDNLVNQAEGDGVMMVVRRNPGAFARQQKTSRKAFWKGVAWTVVVALIVYTSSRPSDLTPAEVDAMMDHHKTVLLNGIKAIAKFIAELLLLIFLTFLLIYVLLFM